MFKAEYSIILFISLAAWDRQHRCPLARSTRPDSSTGIVDDNPRHNKRSYRAWSLYWSPYSSPLSSLPLEMWLWTPVPGRDQRHLHSKLRFGTVGRCRCLMPNSFSTSGFQGLGGHLPWRSPCVGSWFSQKMASSSSYWNTIMLILKNLLNSGEKRTIYSYDYYMDSLYQLNHVDKSVPEP